MLAALQTVLFEKHSVGGGVADAMLPYGSKVRPEIRLEFEHNGERYRLYKAFCQKPAADLRADSGARWTDDAAEEQLREMLEFTPPGKGGAKPDHRGLQALFWVEQGSASGQPHINETAQTSLASALETEVGTVTGGERGRTLIRRIEARVSEIFTQKTRKPAGAYRDAIAEASAARERRADLATRLKDFEVKVEALARARDLLDKLEADDPIGVADARLELARASDRNVQGLETDLKAVEANSKAAQSQHVLAKSRLKQRQESRKVVAEADRAVADLKKKEASAKEEMNDAQRIFSSAVDAHRTAKTVLDNTQRDAAAARRLAALLRKSDELIAAEGPLKKAETAEGAAAGLTAKAAASSLTPETIEQLRQLDRHAREEAARLKAVATLIELAPNEGRGAAIDGRAVGVNALTLVAPTEIGLDGYGTIRVTPGGEDLANRQTSADAAATKLRVELDKHGATDLQDAEQLGKDRVTWLSEAKIHRATVKAHAAKGLDALRDDVARLKAEVDLLRKEAGDAGLPSITTDEAVGLADRLAKELDKAQADEREASDTLKDAKAEFEAARTSLSVIVDQRETAERQVASLRGALELSAQEESDEDLADTLRDTTAAVLASSENVKNAEKALAESDPAGARRELKAAIDARTRVEASLREKREQARDLEVELRTLGKDDTMAEIDVADGEVARAEAREGRLAHEAAALALLQHSLAVEEQVARETFLAPVRERIEPYLKRLFPGSELVLDDQSLKITHLRRDGLDEPYDRLSIGTREQLAVLARLAFADLLDEHGKKSPIILDDAQVFSDDRRFEEMQRILDRAAERLQIIVLTCHERAYFDRGWTTKRIMESKPAPAGRASA